MQTFRKIQAASARVAPYSAPYLLCVIVGAFISFNGLTQSLGGI